MCASAVCTGAFAGDNPADSTGRYRATPIRLGRSRAASPFQSLSHTVVKIARTLKQGGAVSPPGVAVAANADLTSTVGSASVIDALATLRRRASVGTYTSSGRPSTSDTARRVSLLKAHLGATGGTSATHDALFRSLPFGDENNDDGGGTVLNSTVGSRCVVDGIVNWAWGR